MVVVNEALVLALGLEKWRKDIKTARVLGGRMGIVNEALVLALDLAKCR